MEQIKDGGPAFPVSLPGWGDNGASGMTLRDYFIAHAPAEPQPWFEPVMPPKPKAPVVPASLLADADVKWEYDCWREDCLDPRDVRSPALREVLTAIEQARRDESVWNCEWRKQQYIQWPAAWADAQLAAREGKS